MALLFGGLSVAIYWFYGYTEITLAVMAAPLQPNNNFTFGCQFAVGESPICTSYSGPVEYVARRRTAHALPPRRGCPLTRPMAPSARPPPPGANPVATDCPRLGRPRAASACRSRPTSSPWSTWSGGSH